MTDNFKCIYQILRALEAAMDIPEFGISQISCEKLGISRERWGTVHRNDVGRRVYKRRRRLFGLLWQCVR